MAEVYSFDDFELDVERSELRRAGVPLKVEALVLRLLEVFVRHPNELISKSQLLALAWDGRAVSENSLTVAITRLRKALGENRATCHALLTVHGRGYRFVRSVSTIVDRPRAAKRIASHAPLVGRESALKELQLSLLDANEGKGGLQVLVGESGIGKTRLAETLAEEAACAGVIVAWGYCRELGSTPPLWPIVGLLRHVYAELTPALSSDPGVQALAPQLSPWLPELMQGAAQPSAACGVDAASKHHLFDAIVRLLVLAAQHKPLLLIIDDLHCADEVSVDLIRYAQPALSRARILTLCTAQNVSHASSEIALSRLLRHPHCKRLHVEPLRHEDVASYLLAVVDGVSDALTHLVYRMSEGNAFCMVELARQLRQSPQQHVATLELSNVALEMARHRLARLPEATHDLLTAASIIGRSFSLPLLRALSAAREEDSLGDLDAAVKSDVIERLPSSATEFRFTHDLLRSALYRALAPGQRRSWHLRLAQVLEARRTYAETAIADLAYHAWSALPEGDLRKTVSFCTEAANAAARAHALREAGRFMQRAREALDLMEDASPRLRYGLLFRQAISARWTSTQEFLPIARQLLDVARAQADGLSLAQAALLLDPFPGFPRLPISGHALVDALAGLPADAPCLRAALMARLSWSAPRAFDAAESTTLIEQALQLAASSPEPTDRFSTRFGELYLYGGPAHRKRADEALVQLQRLCNDNRFAGPLPPMLLDIHRALCALQAGDVPTAANALQRCIACCRENDVELLWHMERCGALLRMHRGETREGRRVLLELHQRARREEPVFGAELFCAYDEAVVLGTSDKQPGWQRVLMPEAGDTPNIWALKLRALAAAGAHMEARHALHLVAAERLTRLPCDREYLGTLGALTRATLALGATDYARVLYELLSPYAEHFSVNLSFSCEGTVAQLLGMLAHSFGELELARRHFEAAIALSETAGLATCAQEARRLRDALTRVA